MHPTPTPIRCQVCGRPLGDRPIWLAASPDGATVWAMHYDVRDCVRATVPQVAPQKEARRAA